MRPLPRKYRLGIALVFAGFLACSRAPEPAGIKGTVTLDAQPISEGRIEFEPLPNSPAQHRDAEIRDGAFALPTNEGLLPGEEFCVRIKAFRKTGRQIPAPEGMPPFDEYDQYLPEKFNSTSELRIRVQEDELQNHFDFHLQSEPGLANSPH